ncbi:MAG: GNAT family N-acetyltransferase [Theionarchaea archaeon]|nr:GNAT family N-acetyltransferase [Theionarchaea archaeon]
MKIDTNTINEHTIEDLFSPCRECVYWEAPEKCGHIKKDEAFHIKKKWFQTTTHAFGNCGSLLYVDGNAVAYTQYCLPHFLENAPAYAELFPVSRDTLLISCLHVREGYRKRELGTILLHSIIQQARAKGIRAFETYARDDSPNNCSGPTAFYRKNGFTVLAQKKWGNATFSLVRAAV